MCVPDFGVAARLNRLTAGWRDITEDTRRLGAMAEALPDSCDCKVGGGRCASCTALGHAFPDQCRTCTSHARALSPRIAAVLDDTLRYLPTVESVESAETVLLQRLLRDVARAMIQLLRGVDAMQSATGDFSHGCRTEHIVGLKRLVSRLRDAIDRAHP